MHITSTAIFSFLLTVCVYAGLLVGGIYFCVKIAKYVVKRK